jgi:uncharacterized cupin superfamily protein
MSDRKPLALDPATLPERRGSTYPAPFKGPVASRRWRALGAAFGLTQFGVNLVELEPGAWSSQRHWHSAEDELIYVLEGELVLVTEAGEQVLGPGLVAGFPAGEPNGHHLVNRSGTVARFLAIGSRIPGDECTYPDIDLHVADTPQGDVWTNKRGERYGD